MSVKRNEKGEGSVYQRKDGLWAAKIDVGKNRWKKKRNTKFINVYMGFGTWVYREKMLNMLNAFKGRLNNGNQTMKQFDLKMDTKKLQK